MVVLSRRGFSFGAVSLGWDTIAGAAVLVAAMKRRAARQGEGVPPWLFGNSRADEASVCNDLSGESAGEKRKLLVTVLLLLLSPVAFAITMGPVCDILLTLLTIVLPISRSGMLGMRLFLEQSILYVLLAKVMEKRHGFFSKKWVRWSFKGPWLAPVLGGYMASLTLFNLAEPINQALFPHLSYLAEGMVAKLANPPDKSIGSLLIGSITPCVGAPLFEELQSRAFILQALSAIAPMRLALVISGLLFGAQHMQVGLVLPLSVTGWFWAVMYVNSGNLLVPILIHALWNARIFAGSFLAL